MAKKIIRPILQAMKDKKISHAARSAKAAAQTQESVPYRILVVNDDSDLRQVSAEVLTRSGYAVDVAMDAHAAWKALNAAHYDLLITENKLQHMTGLELLAKLRVARMALPVIVASADLPSGKFTRHPWLQPAVALPMPYTTTEFLGTVQEVLRTTPAAKM